MKTLAHLTDDEIFTIIEDHHATMAPLVEIMRKNGELDGVDTYKQLIAMRDAGLASDTMCTYITYVNAQADCYQELLDRIKHGIAMYKQQMGWE